VAKAKRHKGTASKLPPAAPSSLEWTTEQRRIGDLVEWESNPRQLTEKQAADLTESLKRFGYVEPIAINTDGMIVGGHQRKRMLLAMAQVNPKQMVDVRVPSRELTEDEFVELAIRLNRNLAGWDWDKLANEFEATDLIGWGFAADEMVGDFGPGAPEDQGHLDQKQPPPEVECPSCKHRFTP